MAGRQTGGDMYVPLRHSAMCCSLATSIKAGSWATASVRRTVSTRDGQLQGSVSLDEAQTLGAQISSEVPPRTAEAIIAMSEIN